MKLQKYKLKASIRKKFDKLSDEDKVLFIIENYDIKNIAKIVTYYGLENQPLLRTLSLEKFAINPRDAYFCAFFLIKGRWFEAEDTIKASAEYACHYAHYVIKGRWFEAEDTIKTHIHYAYQYACHVIKGRWIEAEHIFRTSEELWKSYKEFIK
jgi:hypothetical protein